MNLQWTPWYLVVIALPLMIGCQSQSAMDAAKAASAADQEAEIRAFLAKLSPEDQRLAQEQKYCPVMPDVLLGQMGTPFKVVAKGETMFVCCKNCVQLVQEDPESALRQLKEIRQARQRAKD